MKKEKILIISEPGSGGVKRHVIDLLKNLDSRKFNIFFAYSKNRADLEYLKEIEELSNQIFCKEIKNLQQSISCIDDIVALYELIKLIKYIKPDVVHCHSSKAGVLGRIAAKICGVKNIIYTPHAYSFQNLNLSQYKRSLYILIERALAYLCTDKTINVSYGEMDIALENKIGKKEKFTVIYNGVNLKKIEINDSKNSKSSYTKDEIIVGNIARFEEQKNPLEFFKIAKLVNMFNQNIKFVWIGNGHLLNKCQEFINVNKLSDICMILPFNKETEKLLTTFDIFLNTSLYEGYPYILLDASVNEIPIIATNVVGNNEIVKNRKNGFLYEIGDIEKVDIIIEHYYNWKDTLEFNIVQSIKEMIESIQKVYLME